MVRPARLPLLTFAFLATGIYAVAVIMVRMRPELRHPDAVSAGLLIDLLVVVPLVFYVLPIRRAGWPARTLIPLFLLSLTGAALVLPDQREMLKRVSEILSIPAEIGLVAWIAGRTRRSLRGTRGAGADDMLDRLRNVAREIVPLRGVAEAIGFEMAVVYYSLFAWRRRSPSPPATRVFTYHRTGSYGALGFALLIVTIAEAIPVHLLVTRWSSRGAWLLTALAAYGMLWFLADYRATRLRPILLDEDILSIRTGLRWTVRIPRAHIVAIHKKAPKAEPFIRATLPGTTPLWIELSEPVTAQGPYGKEKTARWISVAVDEAKAFREAVVSG
ncbi:MAG TPA: hypothetical protein VH988_06790 [Thermoanaerobaculia bacterium]|jgi:hypothetical protein|nr:hypothetical protein [Thermoanaerobaculia bacterium]